MPRILGLLLIVGFLCLTIVLVIDDHGMQTKDIPALVLTILILYYLVRSPFDIARSIRKSQMRTSVAKGTVLDVRLRALHWGVNVPRPSIEFTDAQGNKSSFVSSSGASWNAYPVGSHVVVRYDPNDPSNAEPDPTPGMVFFGRLVGAFVIGGIGFGIVHFVLQHW